MVFREGRPVCIVNPHAAAGRTGRDWPRLRFEMERTLGPIDSLLTGARGDAIELARAAAQQGASLVVAVGGDGTISEVVNGLMQASGRSRDLALGIIPSGTGGDLARSLGIPSSSAEALRILLEGRKAPLDVGRIDFPGAGREPATRYFVNIASIGIEGLVDRNLQTGHKRLGGKLGYLWATLQAAAVYRPAPVLLRSGELELRRTVFSAVIANGRFFGGGMEIAPGARLDDGRLELVVIRGAPLWRLALQGRRLYNGTLYQGSFVEHFSITSLDAASDSDQQVWLGIDGEPVGELPARFSVQPSALQVVLASPDSSSLNS